MRNLSLREVNERYLVAAEWLDPDMRGLDNRSWKLNKYVTEQFAERRRLEEEQKQQIARPWARREGDGRHEPRARVSRLSRTDGGPRASVRQRLGRGQSRP